MIGVCTVAGIAAFAFILLKVRTAAENGDSPSKFSQDSILALALSEFITLMGFLYAFGPPPTLSLYLPYAAVSILINLGLILPLGLAYWASRD